MSEPERSGIDWSAVLDDDVDVQEAPHPLTPPNSPYAPEGVPHATPRYLKALAVHRCIDGLTFWGVIAIATYLTFVADAAPAGLGFFAIACAQRWGAKWWLKRLQRLKPPHWEWPEVAVSPPDAPLDWTLYALHNAQIAYEDLLDMQAENAQVHPDIDLSALRLDIRRDVTLAVRAGDLLPDGRRTVEEEDAALDALELRLGQLIEAEAAQRGTADAPPVRVLRHEYGFTLLGAIPRGIEAMCEAIEAACRRLAEEQESSEANDAADDDGAAAAAAATPA